METAVAMEDRILFVEAQHLFWPFRGEPYYQTRPLVGYPEQTKVDPFPCYSHDADLVYKTAAAVEASFPVSASPQYYLTHFEDYGRTNGWANRYYDYRSDDKPYPWYPYIVLQGKRIPPHSAMTRYLVAHEYGHVVQWEIEKQRGIKAETVTELDREYANLRGMVANEEYGGGRWHSNVGELFANDFRILVTGVETEFWPHPGFDRPESVQPVVDFWKHAREHYTAKPD